MAWITSGRVEWNLNASARQQIGCAYEAGDAVLIAFGAINTQLPAKALAQTNPGAAQARLSFTLFS
jgi:hypothetical protein